MPQSVQFDVIHEAANCPAAAKETLVPLIKNLKELESRLAEASDGKVTITAQWYERNAHAFHYLCEVDGLHIAAAEDCLKQAIGLPVVTVRSYPTESGEQALAALEAKLSH